MSHDQSSVKIDRSFSFFSYQTINHHLKNSKRSKSIQHLSPIQMVPTSFYYQNIGNDVKCMDI